MKKCKYLKYLKSDYIQIEKCSLESGYCQAKCRLDENSPYFIEEEECENYEPEKPEPKEY